MPRLIALCALAASAAAWGAPTIQILDVPHYGSLGALHGRVSGVIDPQNYGVTATVQAEGSGWWTKPYFSPPTVAVNADGTFAINVTTGGSGSLDPRATIYSVSLMASGQDPPLANGTAYLPQSPLFLAASTTERYARTLQFSGGIWGVKESGSFRVGPGPNPFTDDPSSVWVDSADRLHLSVTGHGSDWACTEVFQTRSFGYGRYLFQTSSRVDQLDSNAVFGAFTWDAYGDPAATAGMTNREIDFEDGVWAYPRPAENSQFVVQPYSTPGNRNQFTLPDLSQDADLTRILIWQPDRIHFMIVRGLHEFDDYSADDVVADWTYIQDPSQGHYVPDPGQARIRFNLWLRDGSAPIGDGGLEVVVDRFAYNMPGDANLDGLVDQADYTVWYNHYGAAGGWTEGDFTGDGLIDQADYTVWYNNYGASGGSVPEPMGLTALVLGVLTILRRRKQPISRHSSRRRPA